MSRQQEVGLLRRECMALVMSFLVLTSLPGAAVDAIVPVHWGPTTSGGPHDLWQRTWADQLIQEFGFDVFCFQSQVFTANISSNITKMQAIDAFCGRNGMNWMLVLETANYNASFMDQNGYDWYNRPDGRHYFQLPDTMLTALGNCQHALGATLVEAEHMQNCRNYYAGVDKPFIYDPAGDALADAASGFAAAAQEVYAYNAQFGVQMHSVGNVFPILLHGFARAGITPGVMLLQYNWCGPYMACGIGAAVQYDKHLWAVPNLWNHRGEYPGHSVDEYRSALLLAYHLGADYIVSDNLAYDHLNAGVGSLILVNARSYTVTPYGEVAKWFGKTYVPENPRRYSFHEVRPRVAIIKQDDAFWGQNVGAIGEPLFGNPAWIPADTPAVYAWLDIWELLTRGVVSHEGLNWLSGRSYYWRSYQVFCPLDGVVVFDETVGADHLRGVEVVFLTGLGVSPATLNAVQNEVRDGATCIGFPHLMPAYVTAITGNNGEMNEGAGKWVATEDFLATHVSDAVQHVLPDSDTIRYQFGNDTVTFHTIDGDPNRLSVTVQTDVDSDDDSVPDWWEHDYRLDWENPADAAQDEDSDGLSNRDEFTHDANPRNPDSDGDGLLDGAEVHIHGTDPTNWDTSQNGIPDGWLVEHGLDPLDAGVANQDPDHDGYSNWYEYFACTDPNDPEGFPALPLDPRAVLPSLLLVLLTLSRRQMRRVSRQRTVAGGTCTFR